MIGVVKSQEDEMVMDPTPRGKAREWATETRRGTEERVIRSTAVEAGDRVRVLGYTGADGWSTVEEVGPNGDWAAVVFDDGERHIWENGRGLGTRLVLRPK